MKILGLLLKLLLTLLIILAVCAPIVWEIGFSWWMPVHAIDYSDGERTGLLTKISYKGFPCKKWEGHILVGNGNNVAPEDFYFNTTNGDVAKELQQDTGKVITVTYTQYLYTSACWGATDYNVTAIK